MALVGDLVTELVADASGYQPGIDKAIAANKAFGGSLDNIIGRLEKQKQVLAGRVPNTIDNIRKHAASGADPGKVLKAGSLLDDVEALKKDKAAKEAAKKASDELILSLEKQAKSYGLSTNEIKRNAAVQAGASTETLQAASRYQHQIDMQVGFDRMVQRSVARTREEQRKNNTGQLALIESTRGLEDAVVGYTQNGLRGMVMATSNNVAQVGALIGGNAALYASLAGIAALIGTSLIPKLEDMLNRTEEIAAFNRGVNAQAEFQHTEEMRRVNQKMDAQVEINELVRNNARTLADFQKVKDPNESDKTIRMKNAIRDQRDEEQKQSARQWREIARQRDLQREHVGLGMKGGLPPEILAQRELMKEEDRRRLEDKDRAAQAEWNKSVDAQHEAHQKQLLAHRQAARLEAELQKSIAKERREQRAQELEELRQLDLENQRKGLDQDAKYWQRNKQNRADLGRELREMMGKESSIMATELEREEKKRERHNLNKRALNEGIITQEEAWKIGHMINKPEQFAMGGPSAAVQSGSTAAYSTIVKAMNKSANDDFERKQYEEQKAMRELLDKIEQKETINVVVIP